MANFTGQLISTLQTLTSNWENLGDLFDIDTYKSVLLSTEITPNNSTGIKFRALIFINEFGSQLTKKIVRTQSADLIIPSEEEIGELSDSKTNLTFKIPDGATDIQIQVMAENVGATAGTIDEAFAARSYNSDFVGEKIELSSIKLSNDEFATPTGDDITHNLVAIDQSHHEIHEGDFYSFCDYVVALDSGNTLEFILTTPNTAKWSHLTYNFSATLKILFELFEDTTHTTDTLQTSFNHNRNSSNIAGMTIHTSNDDVADGTRIDCGSFGSPSVGIVGGSGGGSRSEAEWILKPNSKYLIRLTSGSNDNNVNLKLSWYEHQNKI